jgi:hypothetical protein
MTMTRRDYRLIAAAIRSSIDGQFEPKIDDVVDAIADALEDAGGLDANGNRRFDRDRFLEAAGVR